MKNFYVLASILIIQLGHSQTQQERETLYSNIKNGLTLNAPPTPAEQDITFTKIYSKIFSTVVLGNADIITNGSAFAYSQDNLKNTFSINGTTRLSKLSATNPQPWLLDLGISIKNKDNTFNYYQNNTWQSDISLKMGLIIPWRSATLYFTDSKIDQVQKYRNGIMAKKMDSLIVEILNTDKNVTANRLQKLKDYKADNSKLTGFADLDSRLQLKVNVDELIAKEDKKLKDQKELFALDASKISELNDKYSLSLDNSDIVQEAYEGYSSLWTNLSGTYTNSSIKFENPTIFNETVEDNYKSISKATLDTSLNWQMVTSIRQYFYHISGGFKANRMSYIDNPDFKGKKFSLSLNTTTNNYELLADGLAPPIGTYHDLHDAVLTADAYFNFAFIPNSARNFVGVLLKSGVNSAFKGQEHQYANNYTLLLGPMFRLSKEKVFSSATFSILGGFETVSYGLNAWDNFLLKATAAFPFNVFEKKKK